MGQPRYEGKLKKWDADRGYGFITADDGGQDVFVHITAFARDGRQPQVGEALTFEVEPDRNGKRSAVRVQRAGHLVPSPSKPPAPRQPRMSGSSHASWAQKLVLVVLLVVLAVFGYSRYANRVKQMESAAREAARTAEPSVLFESPQPVPSPPTPLPPMASPATPAPLFESKRPAQSSFSCDGRQHCSQMTSCEEAHFFLKNCPNTKMDGDHDGKPCERGPC